MSSVKQEIVIIGAGVIGLATAYELAKKGKKVTIIEKKDPGWAASYGNAGMIYPDAGQPMVNPHHMMAGIGWLLTRGGESPLQFSIGKIPSFLKWAFTALKYCNNSNFNKGKKAFHDLRKGTFDHFENYKKDGIKYEEHKGEFLSVFLSRKEFEKLRYLYSQDPSVEALTGDQAREREPFLSKDIVGALQLKNGFTSVHPITVCNGLVKKLKELGVEIITGQKIIKANRENNKIISLVTEGGVTFQASTFIIAAGGWSGNMAKLMGSYVPITGGKGYAITIENPSKVPTQTIFLGEYEAVIIPFDGKLRFTGFLELSGVDMTLFKKRIKSLKKVVGRYTKETGNSEELWTGMRACTPDGIPAIGLIPGLENVWMGSGHWHFGLTLAPSTAIMLAELITTGQSSVDNRPFDPRRF